MTEDDKGNKISYTEKEYNYALKKNKPIMVFMYKDISVLPAGKVESNHTARKRLEKFKDRIRSSGMQVTYWNNMGELISNIKTSIYVLINNISSSGWVKGTDLNKEGINDEFLSRIDNFNDWGLSKIFRTRAEKNAESDPKLESHNIKKLDGIAFGLSSFRSNREYDVLECLRNGMNMRLLAMNPHTEFAKQRAIEENVHSESISDSIEKLVLWVNELNKQSTKGKIEIKYYNAIKIRKKYR